MTLREQRAEFLMKWFLDVFENRKAPYPSRCFKGISFHMKEFLNGSPPQLRGTGESEATDKSPLQHEEHDAESHTELRPRP